MRYLGLDYGARRIGVAVSDEAGVFAFPRETLANDARIVETLAALVTGETIGAIIVGDTRSLSGGENPITAEAEHFMQTLAERTGIPVRAAREAWSTHEAARFAPAGKRHDDSAAAAIILQRFLEERGTVS